MKKCSILFLITMVISANIFAQSYVPEWKDARIKVKPAIDIKAYAFDVSDVRLLPGMFADATTANVKYLLKIEPDRLLSDFRVHSGLKADRKSVV